MNGPKCIQKLDIRIYEDKVVFSKCCLTEQINSKEIPTDIILSLSDADLENKIFTDFSKLEDVKELNTKLNCTGSCQALWKSEPESIYVSHKFCNYFCIMCRDEAYKSDASKIKECYFKILNSLSKSSRDISIGTTTAGEPFIWKKETLDFIESTTKTVIVTSNLSLIDDEVLNKIDSGEFKNVKLCGSVDSFNPFIYSSIRRPATPEVASRVFEKVEKLIKFHKEGKIMFFINIVLSDNNFNYDDIQNTLTFFESRDFHSFHMSNDMHKDITFYNVDWFDDELKQKCRFFSAS